MAVGIPHAWVVQFRVATTNAGGFHGPLSPSGQLILVPGFWNHLAVHLFRFTVIALFKTSIYSKHCRYYSEITVGAIRSRNEVYVKVE